MNSVKISEPVVLIRINATYKPGMSAESLYDATRASWVIGERGRKGALFAMAVIRGEVLEVYSIDRWTPDSKADPSHSQRWRFEGSVAPATVRDSYVGKSVKSYLTNANRRPLIYINF